MEEVSESKLIVDLIEKCPCFYSKFDENYRNDALKKKFLNDIAIHISKRLNLNKPLTGEDVKTKWDNLRRSFVRAHKNIIEGKESGFYLYRNLLFLESHITHIPKRDATKHLDKKIKTEDELTFEDVIKHADPLTDQKRKFQIMMSKHEAIQKLEDRVNEDPNQSTSKVVPNVSELAKQKFAKKDEIEDKVSQAIEQAITVTKTIAENKENDDCYTLAIRQSLILLE